MPPPYRPTAGAALIHPYKVDRSPFYTHVSHSVRPANVVTTAGQIGRRIDGSIPIDPVEQIQEAFNNLRRCLEAAGARVEDVMKLTYLIVDFDHTKPRHREALLDFLGDHRPPTTLVPVPKLAIPELIFEIEATAAVPQLETETVDVIVVGAGLSGLQTAVDLHNAGLKVKVLEARGRVGGKTFSVPAQGSVTDVGAAWINDSNQARVFALAKRLGLDLITQNTQGKIIVDKGIGSHKTHPYGQLLANSDDKAQIDDAIRLRDLFEATCQQIDITNPVASGKRLREDLDQISFEEWVNSHSPVSDDALNALKVGTRAMLGVEPSEISALFFLDYCKSGGGYMLMRSDLKHGGQFLRFAQGTQSMARGLASELPSGSVVLNSPVRRIEQRPGGVTVRSARGTFHASRVVVSVPTPLYQEIEFDPPLPAEKVELSKSTVQGDTCKSILFFKTPWWREHGLCGLTQSPNGPVAVTRDTSVDADGHYSLTCFVVGQPARKWMKLPRVERDKAVVDQLRRLFSPFATWQEPIQIVEHIWMNEQWSQGCPVATMPPGVLTRFEHVLRAPVNRVHFVGTETSFEWKGYMDGALRSGERGAKEVLLAMNRAKL